MPKPTNILTGLPPEDRLRNFADSIYGGIVKLNNDGDRAAAQAKIKSLVDEMEQAKMEPAMKLIDLVVALSVLQGLDPTRARVAAIEVSGLSGR